MKIAEKNIKLMSWPLRLPSNFFTGLLMVSHPPVKDMCEFSFCSSYEGYDEEFIKHICDYFDEALEKEGIESGSLEWNAIVATHQKFIDLLKSRDYVEINNYLKDMWSKPLAHGMAQGDFFYERLKENKNEIRENTEFGIYDKFISIFEATGIIPLFDPENYQQNMDFLKFYTITPDQYLNLLEDHLECEIKGASYQGGHFGIQTKDHGFFSDRDIMSLGVAIRISETYWNRKDISICDLGGGMGYLPYYLKQLGFDNVTYVDIPTVSVAAKYFLETNMPGHNVKFLTPSEFNGKYDLVVNVDSMIYYNKDVAQAYCIKIKDNCKHFLSINREYESFKISDVCDMKRITRNLFWYRKGYIEEDYVS